MNKKFLSIVLLSGSIVIASCQNKSQDSSNEEPAATMEALPPADLIANSVTDAQGNKLDMEFDNAAGTAKFILGADTIFLKQDTTASGIQFSNDHYLYTEHQGEITLTKDGQTVFERK